MPPRVETVGLGEIADVFGVDSDTIGVWCGQGMPHRKSSGFRKFEVGRCVQWRLDKLKRDARDQSSPDEAKERVRKLAADADMAELKVKERRGELVPAVDVERQVDRLVATVRARVLSIRGRWAPRIIGITELGAASTTLDSLALDVLASLSESAGEIEADEHKTGEAAA